MEVAMPASETMAIQALTGVSRLTFEMQTKKKTGFHLCHANTMMDKHKHKYTTVHWKNVQFLEHLKQRIAVRLLNLPRHSLNESFPEMVESYCDLHCLVLQIGVTVTQEHHLHTLFIYNLSVKIPGKTVCI
jgi:hypothetical protein